MSTWMMVVLLTSGVVASVGVAAARVRFDRSRGVPSGEDGAGALLRLESDYRSILRTQAVIIALGAAMGAVVIGGGDGEAWFMVVLAAVEYGLAPAMSRSSAEKMGYSDEIQQGRPRRMRSDSRVPNLARRAVIGGLLVSVLVYGTMALYEGTTGASLETGGKAVLIVVGLMLLAFWIVGALGDSAG